MIPSLTAVRAIGTAHYDVGCARTIVDELMLHCTGTVSGTTVPADYVALVTMLKPYLVIWARENAGVCPEVIAAVTKVWCDTAWNRDLRCHPETGAALQWKVNEKDADYRNVNGILPPGEATEPRSCFAEYRPFGSIPGTLRLFKGLRKWWMTDNGTHGATAACRAATWWVFNDTAKNWRVWTIVGTTAGSGHGTDGAVCLRPTSIRHVTSTALSSREKYLMKMIRENADQVEATGFGSQTLWSDTEMMRDSWG